jgi:hypothetical protein
VLRLTSPAIPDMHRHKLNCETVQHAIRNAVAAHRAALAIESVAYFENSSPFCGI